MSTNFHFDDDLGASTDRQAQIREQAHIVNGGEQHDSPCQRCAGSGRWRGYARTFPCNACNGTGRVTVRKAAGQKAQVTKRANEAAWREEHHELLSQLHGISEWNNVARELLAKVSEYGTLKDWQIEKAWTMLAKIATRREEKREERKAQAPEVNISAIQALFDGATENAVKRPIFRTDTLTLSKAPATGKNPGAIYVKGTDSDAYLGKIVAGKFMASRDASAETLEQLRIVADNPMDGLIRYARKTSACGICGKGVVNPVSILAVVGPVCAQKWNLEHLRQAAAEEYARMQAEEEGRAA